MAHNNENSTHCLNCDAVVTHQYCGQCGQKYSDNHDRSLKKFLGDLISSFTFADSRFFLTIRTLLFSPGKLTVDFLSGKKRRFMQPLGLFLFVNILFFLVSPINDYSLSLHEQTHLQFYSDWINPLVERKISERGITFSEYQDEYNAMSDNLSKSAIILNIPAIALLLWPVVYARRKWYYDSFIFVFHYFAFMLFCITLGFLGYQAYSAVLGPDTPGEGAWFLTFIVLLPFVYGVISMRNFTRYNYFLSGVIAFWLLIDIMAVQFAYRFVIFLISFIST